MFEVMYIGHWETSLDSSELVEREMEVRTGKAGCLSVRVSVERGRSTELLYFWRQGVTTAACVGVTESEYVMVPVFVDAANGRTCLRHCALF